MRLCFLVMSEATLKKSHQHDFLNERNNDYDSRHAKVEERKATRPHPYLKDYRQVTDAESGRNCLL